MKAGGDLLLLSGFRQQVAGDLFDGEASNACAVEGIDDPVSPGPMQPRLVAFVSLVSA